MVAYADWKGDGFDNLGENGPEVGVPDGGFESYHDDIPLYAKKAGEAAKTDAGNGDNPFDILTGGGSGSNNN